MSNENSPPPSPSFSGHARRASVMPGTSLKELLGKSPTGTTAYPGPIAAAAQAQQRRRMSISTIGLSGSPTQTSPFNAIKSRQGSSSSNGSGSPTGVEDSAVDDGDATTPLSASPFARRMSFGARAMRDVRAGNIFNGRNSLSKATSPPQGRGSPSTSEQDTATRAPSNTLNRRTGEGFNVSESLRSRAERSTSFSSSANPSQSSPIQPKDSSQQRAASVAAPVKKSAPPAPRERVPDHFQERILKGEFLAD